MDEAVELVSFIANLSYPYFPVFKKSSDLFSIYTYVSKANESNFLVWLAVIITVPIFLLTFLSY